MKIKTGLDINSQDFFYDLTNGGYLDPFDICENIEDAERVYKSIKILVEFRDSIRESYEDFLQ